ncbi:unnamed protein product, partial [Adineta ricciae]
TAISKYTRLPYVIDHAQLSHRQWLLSALLRAVHFCTNVHDFIQERLYLEMTCLLYGYSVEFIETQLKRFYRLFHLEHHRFNMNQNVYHQFRRQTFDFARKQLDNLKIHQQSCDTRDCTIYIHYLYGYGYSSEVDFQRQFYRLWSLYF